MYIMIVLWKYYNPCPPYLCSRSRETSGKRVNKKKKDNCMARNNTRKHIYISQKSIFKICAVHVIYTHQTNSSLLLLLYLYSAFSERAVHIILYLYEYMGEKIVVFVYHTFARNTKYDIYIIIGFRVCAIPIDLNYVSNRSGRNKRVLKNQFIKKNSQ